MDGFVRPIKFPNFEINSLPECDKMDNDLSVIPAFRNPQSGMPIKRKKKKQKN